MAKKKPKLPEYKDGGWIKKAINPKHKGYCTPMTKSTCTPRRKALARRFKKGGDLHKGELGTEVANQQEQDQAVTQRPGMLTPGQLPLQEGQVGNEFIHAMGSNPAVGTTIQNTTESGRPKLEPIQMNRMEADPLPTKLPTLDAPQKIQQNTKVNVGEDRTNPYRYFGLPYHAAMSGIWGDEIGRDKKNLADAEGRGDEDAQKTYRTQLVGDKLSVAGHAIAGGFNTASTVLGAWSKGIHDRRVAMDEQAIMLDEQKDRAELRGPYRGDDSELGGGTNPAFTKYGGKIKIKGYGGKLGYLEHGGINNYPVPTVKTERGEITNNTQQVFQEGGDKHSDPSGGNTRAYRPGSVVHSAALGMNVGDMANTIGQLPLGDYAASKLTDMHKDPNKPISFADATKPFVTKELDKKIVRLKKKVEDEEMYVDSPNETRVSKVTSRLNLSTLGEDMAKTAMERDMNLLVTGPEGPFHKASESLKQSGAYGKVVKDESKANAKYGKKIKLPKAQFSTVVTGGPEGFFNQPQPEEDKDGVVIQQPANPGVVQSFPYTTEKGTNVFSPSSVTNFKSIQWNKPDQPRAAQSLLGYQPGFNASPYRQDPARGLTDLQGLGFDPTAYQKSWEDFSAENVQDFLMNLDKQGSKTKDPYEATKSLYNRYLTTNAAPEFEGKNWEELTDQDREKFFKDDKYGVRTYLLGKFLQTPEGKAEQKKASALNLPTSKFTKGTDAVRGIYHEGLDPRQIWGPMMDLFTPKKAVPYIENVGDKNALAASTRQRFTDIQPQLNRITRGTMAQTRNLDGTPVNQARGAQAYSNAYEAANQVYGEKYNRDAAIQKQYEDQQSNLMSRAGANKAQALDTLAQRTATRDWKDYALRRNAFGEIGNKMVQQHSEDRAAALYQDMFRNYGYNPITGGTSFTGGSPIAVGPGNVGVGSTKDRKVYRYDAQGNLSGTDVYDYNDPYFQPNPFTGGAIWNRKDGGKVKLPKKSPKRAK